MDLSDNDNKFIGVGMVTGLIIKCEKLKAIAKTTFQITINGLGYVDVVANIWRIRYSQKGV
jgi:hypothetical protein